MELPENIVAVVGVDNAGNIVNIDASLFSTVTTEQIKQAASTDSPYAIAERTAPQLSPSEVAVAGFNLALTPGFFPIANDTGDNLEDSIMSQFMGKVGVNTKTPFHKFEVRGGSINIDQLIKTDGYKLSGVNFGYYEKALSTIFMGNATTADMISMNALTLSGLELLTPISKLRGIGVDDNGVVSTTMVRSDGTEFSVVNSLNATLATLTATAGLNLSTINHATTNTDKFLVSDAGVVKYRTAAEVLLDLDAVPYTGAYKNVNLGEWGITAGNFIFDTTPTGIPTAQGSMYWDAAEETVALIMNGTTQRVGQDLFYPVKNQTGSTIPKGTGVRFAGTLGASGRLLIAPFIANGTYPSKYFMGLTAEDIPNGADGQVIAFGKVRKVNTSSFTNGDILYASTTVAGGFQTTAPTAPNNIVTVAAVVYADNNNGELLVRVSPGSNISEDEGIKLTSLANKNVLQYNSSNALWENKSLYDAGIAGLGTTTANTLAYFDTIGTLSSLNTSTYPSLSEIAYVKGVTGPIQAQIDGKQPQLNGTGFVKASGTTITYDNSTYLTTISGIAAGGELSGTYPNPSLVNAAVTNKVLTGLNIIGGSIVATDTILEGFGKLQNQLNALSGAVIYQGVWNATTNTPTLTSSVGTKGYYYIVNVAGSTNLNGVTDWKIGDWVIFDGTTWNKVDNTDSVTSVNGYIGAVSLTTSDIPEALTPVNLYFTNARARAALSAGAGISYNSTTGEIASTITQYTDALARASLSFTAGSGAYNSTTGVITIPTNTTHLTNGANFTSGTLTSGYVPYATGAQSLADSSIFHSSGRILIGSATDDTINALQVTGSIKQTSVTSAMLSADATGKLISGGSGTANYLPLWATANTLTNSWIYHSVYHTSVNGIGFMPSGAVSEVVRIESNGRVYIGATSSANASLALNVHAQGNTSLVTRFNAGNLYAMTRFMQDETNFRGVGTGYDVSEQAGFIYGTSPNSSTDSLLKFVVLDGTSGVWGITTTVKKRTLNFPNLYSSDSGLATGDMYYDANGILRLAGVGTGGGSGSGVTGTGTTNYVSKWTGAGSLGNSLIYDGGAYIGINTTSSGYTLNINGTFNVSGATYFNGVNSLIGSSYFKASSTQGFTVNNSTDTQNNFISYDNGNAYVRGNFGVGTTSAGGKFEVYVGASGATAVSNGSHFILQNSAAVGMSLLSPDANASRINFGTASNNRNAIIYSDYNAGSQTLAFYVGSGVTSATEKMRITSTGNLLINTTTDAGYKLDVNGTARFSGNVIIQNTSDTYGLTLAQSNALNAGWGQWADTSGNFKLSRYGGGSYESPALTITLAGAATFSSTVTASQFIKSGGASYQYLMADGSVSTISGLIAGLTSGFMPYANSSVSLANTGLYYDGSHFAFGTTSPFNGVGGTALGFNSSTASGGSGGLIFGIDGFAQSYLFFSVADNGLLFDTSSGTNLKWVIGGTPRLTILSTGAATFSSSITATSIVKSGGTSSQYLMADGSVSTGGLINSLTAGYVPKATGATTLGNSLIYDNGIGIGINTTSVGATLDVNGTIYARSVSGIFSDVLTSYSGGDLTLGYGASGNLLFKGGSGFAERMRLTSAGNLGIGTTSPNFPLTIDKSGSYTLGLLNSNIGTVGQYTGLTFGYTGSSYQKGAIYYVSQDSNGRGFMQFALEPNVGGGNVSTANTVMTLNYSGNLGLGVTPSAWLAGYKVIELPAISIFSGGGSGGFIFGNAYINTSGSMTYQSTGTATAYNNQGGVHQWSIAPSGTAGATATFTQAMTLDASGNLGVGTPTPSSYQLGGKFAVAGLTSGFYFNDVDNRLVLDGAGTNRDLTFYFRYSSSATILSDSYLIFGTNTVERGRITEDGNWLINTTTNEGYKLDVNGTGRFSGNVAINGSANSLDINPTSGQPNITLRTGNTFRGYIEGNSSGGLSFGAGSSASIYMTLTSTGNVGIGTTSPTSMLTLNGTTPFIRIERSGVNTWQIQNNYLVNQNGFSINNISAGTTPFFIGENGNVGIATASTLYKLTVNTASSVFFGVGVTSFTGTDNAVFLSAVNGGAYTSIPMAMNASIIGFYTGFTEAGRIDGSQNWFIGGTGVSGGGKLQVTGDVNISGQFKINGSAIGGGVPTSRTLTINGTTYDLSADRSWSVAGIGGSGSSGYLSKFSSTYDITNSLLYDDGSKIVFGGTTANANNTITFNKITAEESYINFNAPGSGGSNFCLQFQTDGTTVGSVQTSSTATFYNTSSDYRLKTDYKPFSGIELVNKINTYDFAWKINGERNFGVKAHELQEILPYAVTGIKDGKDFQSVDYSKIVPVLIQAVKDQQKEIETLKQQLK